MHTVNYGNVDQWINEIIVTVDRNNILYDRFKSIESLRNGDTITVNLAYPSSKTASITCGGIQHLKQTKT